VKPRSFRLYTVAWQKIDDFGPLATARIDKVDAPLVNQFAAHLQQKGFAVISVNNTLRTLRRALFLAFEWRLLNREPRTVVKLLPGERQREYVLSEDDEARVIEAAAPSVKAAITLAIDTGLRLGEISALEWSDVEMTDTNGNSTPVAVRVRDGKTKNARRRVPVTKRVAALLETPKTTARPDVPYVFTPQSRRHAVSDQFLTMLFKKAVRKCNISEDCVFHSLRHTAATPMGAARTSPFVMLKFFGWSSVKIAMRYCHPDADQLERAVAALGKQSSRGRRGTVKDLAAHAASLL